MASRAADSLVHMNAVIEINVVGKIVDPSPFQRFAGSKTRAHGLQIGTIGPNLLVAIHAHGGRRNTRGRSGLYRSVAIAAIDAIIARVMLVAELDGLLNFNPLAGIPGRATDLSGNPEGGYHNEDRSEDGGLRQRVRAVMKNLWHCRSLANTQFELLTKPRTGVQRESLELQTARHDKGTQPVC